MRENMNNDNSVDKSGPRLVILAVDRTLTSWLRLSLSFMALGFILDRLGLILRNENITDNINWLPRPYSFWMGFFLVVVGAISSAAAGIIYTRFRLDYLKQGYFEPKSGIILGATTALVTTIIGIITAIFMTTIAG